MAAITPLYTALLAVAQLGLVPRGSRVAVFQQIYWVFLVLGTIVGVVVVGYMMYNAYAYRADGDRAEKGDGDRPVLGELPSGGGKGRKLFLSFGLSAIIVISLVLWTYATLLYVEAAAQPADGADEDTVTVEVVGRQFIWEFHYQNGHTETGTLRVPEDTKVILEVTSADVWHNFGIPELRVKSDSLPGETTRTWFVANETGTYEAHCYELCGAGHSGMNAEVIVMEEEEFEDWYASTGENGTST